MIVKYLIIFSVVNGVEKKNREFAVDHYHFLAPKLHLQNGC